MRYFNVAKAARLLAIIIFLFVLWQLVIIIARPPSYIVPSPLATLQAMIVQAPFLLYHAAVTTSEILLGFALGLFLGITSALAIAAHKKIGLVITPILVMTQALPVFALAPMLVLWFGYGFASKIAMTVLIIYFPVMAAFLDSMRRTDPIFLDMAETMQAHPLRILLFIRIPSGLPGLAAGMRIAAVSAPIGAVVGEWVGSSQGLGFVMLHANARLETDIMFAALLILSIMAIIIYYAVGLLADRLVWWQKPDD